MMGGKCDAGWVLAKGTRYPDWSEMRLVGWTDGDGSGADGYDMWAYFGADGEYLGADAHGIEPIVAANIAGKVKDD